MYDQLLVEKLVKLYDCGNRADYAQLDYRFGDLINDLYDRFKKTLDTNIESQRLVDEWHRLDKTFNDQPELLYQVANLYRHANHVGLVDGDTNDEINQLHNLVNQVIDSSRVCWPLHVYINYLDQVDDDKVHIWVDFMSALTYLGAVAD